MLRAIDDAMFFPAFYGDMRAICASAPQLRQRVCCQIIRFRLRCFRYRHTPHYAFRHFAFITLR